MTASAADVCGAIALDKTTDVSQPVALPNFGVSTFVRKSSVQ